MRFSSLLTSALLVALSLAQDPNGGAHSDHFDAEKYMLLDQLLITPKTHSNLFSVRLDGAPSYLPLCTLTCPVYRPMAALADRTSARACVPCDAVARKLGDGAALWQPCLD